MRIRFVFSRCCAALIASVVLTVLGKMDAAVITAKSVSLTDVTTAITLAADGDTVVVPAGTATWTSGLNITKGITLQGATTTNTGAYSLASGTNTSAAYNDQTIIIDDVPSTDPLVVATLSPTESFRLTGFTFRYGSVTSHPSGRVVLKGTCPSVRVDHCHFDQLYGQHLCPGGWLYGVIDHCIFDARAGSSEILIVWHTAWGGGTNGFGDGSWADPSYFGSEKFIFIEDCIFNNDGGTETTNGCLDSWFGGRYVCRYNKFNNTRPANHGTETGGRGRSCRAMEIYNNQIKYTINGNLGEIRGGTAVVHDNTYTGLMTAHPLAVFRRAYASANFGGATGGVPPGVSGSWDSNDTRTGPYTLGGFNYNPTNGLYASGQHTGANSSTTLVVAIGAAGNPSPGWATNQWAGFEVTNLDEACNSSVTYYNSRIISNTNNTITYDHSGKTFAPNSKDLVWNTGNRFAIRLPLNVLDQPGSGQGQLLADNPPVNTQQGNTIAWPQDALEPIYAWNNTLNSTPNFVTIANVDPILQANRDFFTNTPKPGYTPYVYPHPLVSGSVPSSTPSPPTNLRIVP